MISFDSYEVVSFDCYGTLIDWETGLLSALKPVFTSYKIQLSDDHILELFSEEEAKIQVREYYNYKTVLKKVMRGLAARFKFTPTFSETECLIQSLKNWEPFPDTVDALRKLKEKYKLAVISNVDDDLFAATARRLQVPFDWTITAEQVKSYKPSLQNFKQALQKMEVAPEKVLHVAQSLYHDIAPANTLGIATVWVNRRKGKTGFGATPAAKAEPKLEVADLRELIAQMEAPVLSSPSGGAA
ncbi:MAG: haloacid dehalogenase type II [bacterium]